jgi:ribonuclease HI
VYNCLSLTLYAQYTFLPQSFSLAELTHLIDQLPTPVILLGDFNSRHPLWGDIKMSHMANTLIRTFSLNSLEILNDGSHTHYHVQNDSFSMIDLSVVSSEIVCDFQWRVIEGDNPLAFDSDHFPILLESIGIVSSVSGKKWSFPRADWGSFCSCTEIVDDCPEDQLLQTKSDYITQLLLSAAEQAIPFSSLEVTKPRVPWWNADCSRAINNKKSAIRRFHRTKNPDHYIEYKRFRAISRRIIRQARRKSWQNYISSINVNTPVSIVWKRVKKMHKKFSAPRFPILFNNGIYSSTPEETSNIFGSSFAKISSEESFPASFLRHKRSSEGENLDFSIDGVGLPYNDQFSFQEFISSLSKCKNTAPGPDGIHYEMIKRAHHTTHYFILSLFNEIWGSGNIPLLWREAFIIPIAKPGKDPSDPLNYRPISLTSCMGKLLEKMISVRLNWFLETNNILSDTQFGFRQGISTANPLLKLSSDVLKSFHHREYTIAVFFDLKKAYDTTWRHGLLRKLYSVGLRGNLPIFLRNFLSDRSFRVKLGATLSSSYPLLEGIPQGSVLSVLCFGLAINDITTIIPPYISHSLYVDDLTIYTSSKRIPMAIRRLQRTVNNLNSWASSVGYSFSSEKTEYMIFRRRRLHLADNLGLCLGGKALRYVSSHKFLGLIFDERLNWKRHVKILKQSCCIPISLLNHLSRISWGSDRHSLRLLYNSLVQSKLDYGTHVYGNASPNTLKTLDSIRNQGLRLISGAFRSSPIDSLHADINMLPLDYHRSLIGFKWYVQMLQRPCIPTPPHFQFVAHNMELGPFYSSIQSIMDCIGMPGVAPLSFGEFPPWIVPPISVCKFTSNKHDLPPVALLSHFLAHKRKYHENSVSVFTDGSKSARGVGASVVVPSKNLVDSASLPFLTSIFSAELIAIILALKLIRFLPEDHITIYSDSFSALQAIRSFNPRHPYVKEIQQWLYKTHNFYKKYISFCWSPGHVGIGGNERADCVAKQCSSHTVLPYNIFFRDLTSPARRIVFQRWQTMWNTKLNNKFFEIKPSLGMWSTSCQPVRLHEVVLCRIRVGHSRLTHAHLMSHEPPPICPFCRLCGLSVKHIFCSCQSTLRLRQILFPHSTSLHPDEAIGCILADGPNFNISKIICFLSRLNILNRI